MDRRLHVNLKESSHFHLYCPKETEGTESRGTPRTDPGTSAVDGGGDSRRSYQTAQAQGRFLNHNEPDRRYRRRQHWISVSEFSEQTRDLHRSSRAAHRPSGSHRRMAESAESTLEELISSLIDGMIEAHAADPELSDLLQAEVPHRADGTRDFSVRLHRAFRRALAPHAREFGSRTDLDMRVFLVSNMIDALGHAIVLRRPPGSSLARARAELRRAILAYLRQNGSSPLPGLGPS